MSKRIALLCVTMALGVATSLPVFAANPISASVASISATDAAALGQVGSRVYSISGADTGINNNQLINNPGCVNNRCLRNYSTLGGFGTPGGYPAATEGTAAYNTDADNQTFYSIWDGQVNGGACNHAAFYAAQGTVASSTTLPTGDFRKSGCVGTLSANCFFRADSANSDPTPLQNVNQGYQGPHTIASVGGLSPVPAVRTSFPGSGCPPGNARLTWDEPETYTGAMSSNVPGQLPPDTPVQGVRLYSISSACSSCPSGSAAGWTPVASFARGVGSTGTCVPITGPTWFALTVRMRGPGNDALSEIETGRVGSSGFVGPNSQCVAPAGTATRITNVAARYAGRGQVNVTWTTGTEGGVQGFYVTRAASPDGPFERVSDEIFPLGDGHTYSVSNVVHAALGRTQYYVIEILDATGPSEHSGSVAVNLPAARSRLRSR